MASSASFVAPHAVDALAAFVRRCPRLFVLTGAGCSTGSGIPGYRDEDGAWKNRPPVQYADFVGRAEARRRDYATHQLVFWNPLQQFVIRKCGPLGK